MAVRTVVRLTPKASRELTLRRDRVTRLESGCKPTDTVLQLVMKGGAVLPQQGFECLCHWYLLVWCIPTSLPHPSTPSFQRSVCSMNLSVPTTHSGFVVLLDNATQRPEMLTRLRVRDWSRREASSPRAVHAHGLKVQVLRGVRSVRSPSGSDRTPVAALPRVGAPGVVLHELGDEFVGEASLSHGRHELPWHHAVVTGVVPDHRQDAIDLLELEAGRLTRVVPAGVGAD